MLSFDSPLNKFYSCYNYIAFTLSTVLLFVVLFCMLKKSSTMGIYKYYMMYTVAASYAFELISWLGKPTPLFPIPAIAVENFFQGYGPAAGYTLFSIYIATVAHYTLALSMAVFYRYVQVFPGRIQDFVNKSRLVPLNFFVGHILYYIILVLPSIFVRVAPSKIASELSINYNISDAEIFVKNHSLIFFSDNNTISISPFGKHLEFPITKGIIYSWLINFSYAGCFTSLLHVVYIWKFLSSIKKTKVMKMKRLHIMFFKTITAQVGLGSVCLLFPSITSLVMVLVPYENGSMIAIFCLILTSSHAFLEYICICYFIKPYREFICSNAKKFYLKVTSRQNQVREENVEPTMGGIALSLAPASVLKQQMATIRLTVSVIKN